MAPLQRIGDPFALQQLRGFAMLGDGWSVSAQLPRVWSLDSFVSVGGLIIGRHRSLLLRCAALATPPTGGRLTTTAKTRRDASKGRRSDRNSFCVRESTVCRTGSNKSRSRSHSHAASLADLTGPDRTGLGGLGGRPRGRRHGRRRPWGPTVVEMSVSQTADHHWKRPGLLTTPLRHLEYGRTGGRTGVENRRSR